MKELQLLQQYATMLPLVEGMPDLAAAVREEIEDQEKKRAGHEATSSASGS